MDLGIKNINQNNWIEPDKVSRGFARITSDGKTKILTGEDYLKHILKPKLSDSVPKEVQTLFEVARGVMVYGYFFYPLYALASEQLFRVAEAAATLKCKELKAPKKVEKFYQKIEWLKNETIIPQEEFVRWDALRQLRNLASHPNNQTILPPGPVIGYLERIAKQINGLFNISK